MIEKCVWLSCLMMMVTDAVCVEVQGDASFLRLLGDKHHPGAQWPSHRSPEDFHRHRSRGVSHGLASRPYEATLGVPETSSELPGFSSSSQEYWRFGSAGLNFTGGNHYGYSINHPGPALVADGSSYRETKPGSHPGHEYQQTQFPATGHVSSKKTPIYYVKGNFHLQSFDAAGKSNSKKTSPHPTSTGQKKGAYPRVHKPYVKHKYPTRKTVHPSVYGNYYVSPYQRYAIPSREMPLYKPKASPSPSSVAQRYHTTERMDDAHPEGSSVAEDYSAYNDAHRGATYYETYEEVEKTTSEPEESPYDESTTRGYYGDRIYMSTQVPLVDSPDGAAVKNKYFIVRRTSSEDEDIETIFE